MERGWSSKIRHKTFKCLVRDGERIEQGGRGKISQATLCVKMARMSSCVPRLRAQSVVYFEQRFVAVHTK